MKKYDLTIQATICQPNELPEELQALVNQAKAKTNDSYCPYSHFHVGAAVLLENGVVVTGTNQENAAYPSGLCAERTAIFYASSQYPNVPMKAIAIAGFTNGHFSPEPCVPCGACRQVMAEYEERFKQPIQVVMYGEKNCLCVSKVEDLLPFVFHRDMLE